MEELQKMIHEGHTLCAIHVTRHRLKLNNSQFPDPCISQGVSFPAILQKAS